MTLSGVSAATVADGNVLVIATPAGTITDITAVTSTQLKATASKDITYDLAASGFSPAMSQDAIDNERFTLPIVLQTPGRKHPTLSLQYFFGDTSNLADTLFLENTSYVIAIRFGVPHDTLPAASQKWDFWPVIAGHGQKDTPAANTNLTKTRAFYINGIVQEDQTLTA